MEFVTCPRCTRSLPDRAGNVCHVCGQDDSSEESNGNDGERTQADIASRVAEIEEMMEAQSIQMKRMRRRKDELATLKYGIDQELIVTMKQYDSAYLAEAIAVEKEKAELTQELNYLQRIKVLPVAR